MLCQISAIFSTFKELNEQSCLKNMSVLAKLVEQMLNAVKRDALAIISGDDLEKESIEKLEGNLNCLQAYLWRGKEEQLQLK